MWLVAPDGGCVGTGTPQSSNRGGWTAGRAGAGPFRVGKSTTDLWRMPMVRTLGRQGPGGSAAPRYPTACHDRRVMSDVRSGVHPLALGSDGYPAAGGVARRPAGATESARANRRWWDAAAPAYLAEHGADLGDADFLWCPEGLRETDARLLGEVAGRRVLEVGCGSAPCSRWLSRQGAHPVAFDLSAGMLRHGRAGNRRSGIAVPLVQADVCALP